MSFRMHAKAMTLGVVSAATLLVAFTVLPLLARGVRVTVTPSNTELVPGQQLDVSVNVDVSQSGEALGSYTATLRWDPRVLEFASYAGGSTGSFDSPVVNKEEAGIGQFIFADANPHGATGSVNIINLTFQVNGAEGSRSVLDIEFSAMAAANTFNDLLEELEPEVTGVNEAVSILELPKEYALHQNHPNPFNPETEIGYDVPRQSPVELAVFNLLGQRVKTLVSGTVEAGKHVAHWDASEGAGATVPSGIYIYRMEAGDFVAEKRMLFLR